MSSACDTTVLHSLEFCVLVPILPSFSKFLRVLNIISRVSYRFLSFYPMPTTKNASENTLNRVINLSNPSLWVLGHCAARLLRRYLLAWRSTHLRTHFSYCAIGREDISSRAAANLMRPSPCTDLSRQWFHSAHTRRLRRPVLSRR